MYQTFSFQSHHFKTKGNDFALLQQTSETTKERNMEENKGITYLSKCA